MEDAQVPRHAGLVNAGARYDIADLRLAMAQHLHHQAARRIGEGLKSI
jgi:hypothetical protein